ncbi:MAG: MaoC family dehydratase [Acidobacteriota bacterium]
MRRFHDLAELKSAVGQTLGVSDWITVTQERIDRFAEATDDFQWIHVDRERAAKSPFGTTIAHGYLTLSLIPAMVYQIFTVDGVGARLNYGSNRIRFTEPVPCNSRLRTHLKLLSAEGLPRGGLRANFEATVEREGSKKPPCIAEIITVMLPPEAAA